VKRQQYGAICEAHREPSPETEYAGALIVGFLASKTVSNNVLLFLSLAVHDIFVILVKMDKDMFHKLHPQLRSC
jgi:hypothetical protein